MSETNNFDYRIPLQNGLIAGVVALSVVGLKKLVVGLGGPHREVFSQLLDLVRDPIIDGRLVRGDRRAGADGVEGDVFRALCGRRNRSRPRSAQIGPPA